jgi:hypothetical protein
MHLNHISLEGLVGAVVFLAGAHLLWKGRDVAMAWLVEFVRILRGEFARRETKAARELTISGAQPAASPRPRSGALILVSALALILLGQILLFLDLTF